MLADDLRFALGQLDDRSVILSVLISLFVDSTFDLDHIARLDARDVSSANEQAAGHGPRRALFRLNEQADTVDGAHHSARFDRLSDQWRLEAVSANLSQLVRGDRTAALRRGALGFADVSFKLEANLSRVRIGVDDLRFDRLTAIESNVAGFGRRSLCDKLQPVEAQRRCRSLEFDA
ncbi:MAG: hypothetical protein AAGK78_16310 [Planctomycetota bacterium]